ncbi:MAG TPA: branched-chain amino acid ABC transporter permease [Acidimicrobiales bacterium]|jgi:branched-chain amino acid transport system permease protein|nr:branched-chain amino acid ABC transporter permease [Acidimicrobiales bacterium]
MGIRVFDKVAVDRPGALLASLRRGDVLAVLVAALWLGWETGSSRGLLLFAVAAAVGLLLPLRPRFEAPHFRWVTLAVAVTAVAPFAASNEYQLTQLSIAAYSAVVLLGLNLIVGVSGQMSFAHVAFMGVGAYSFAIFAGRWNLNFFIALVGTLLVSAVAGLMVGAPALRLRGHYLGVATIVVAVVFPSFVKLDDLMKWTGGVQGITMFERTFGPPVDTAWLTPGRWYYIVAALGLGVGAWVFYALLRSSTGRAAQAIRDNELAARSMGVNVSRVKLLMFSVSAVYAGFAGIIFFLAGNRVVSPDSFTLTLLLEFLAVMVIGGARSIAGAVLGGVGLVYVYRGALGRFIEGIDDPGGRNALLLGAVVGLLLGRLLVGALLKRRAAWTAWLGAAAVAVLGAVLLPWAYRRYGDGVHVENLADAITGVAVIVVLQLMPEGLSGFLEGLRSWRRRGAASGEVATPVAEVPQPAFEPVAP